MRECVSAPTAATSAAAVAASDAERASQGPERPLLDSAVRVASVDADFFFFFFFFFSFFFFIFFPADARAQVLPRPLGGGCCSFTAPSPSFRELLGMPLPLCQTL